jgi:5-formyltetrahydrofolate cyclo-ligase
MDHTLRHTLISTRKQLSPKLQAEKSALIVSSVLQCPAFINASNIAIYHAVNGEADPAALSNKILPSGKQKRFYLPILSPNKNQGLLFGEFTTKTKFKNNKFNIPEPLFNADALVEGRSLDLIIVPLLGFDSNGNRLGMGGGYYDRCFAFKKGKKTKPVLLGFAYDFQQIDSLNPESWDVRLDMIATESQFIDLT